MDLVKSFSHPDELMALFKYKMSSSKQSKKDKTSSETLDKCYQYLNMTSRSFAFIIQQVDEEIRDAVCLFYLVLRALDTVEDDMTISDDVKIAMLMLFHQNLYDAQWNFKNSNEKDRIVLENFPHISLEFRCLKPAYREIISATCKSMGQGMAGYINRPIKTKEEWDNYCHYVAGLVGLGLSGIFVASGLESSEVSDDKITANSMGLFLQKTNIIRDYLEDSLQMRYFWPEEVWTKLKVKKPTNATTAKLALPCLNYLITDALNHVSDVIKYLERLQNPSVFNFCAVPQIMAIATLERCYNNEEVFKGAIKIRRGESLTLMAQATDLKTVKRIFRKYALKIQYRIPAKDPSAMVTFATIENILNLTKNDEQEKLFLSLQHAYLPLFGSLFILIGAILWNYWKHLSYLSI